MAELTVVEVAHRLMEMGKQGDPGRCNADQDFAPVGIFAAAADEGAFLEAVEEAGNVGVAGDHAAGDFAAEEALGGAAQDAEDVVLIRGEVLFFEELGWGSREQVGAAHQLDEHDFFRTRDGLTSGRGYAGHTYKMVVGTDKCQRVPGSGVGNGAIRGIPLRLAGIW